MLEKVQESVENENRSRQKNESGGLRRGETDMPVVVLMRRQKHESGGLRICETEKPAVVLPRRQ